MAGKIFLVRYYKPDLIILSFLFRYNKIVVFIIVHLKNAVAPRSMQNTSSWLMSFLLVFNYKQNNYEHTNSYLRGKLSMNPSMSILPHVHNNTAQSNTTKAWIELFVSKFYLVKYLDKIRKTMVRLFCNAYHQYPISGQDGMCVCVGM